MSFVKLCSANTRLILLLFNLNESPASCLLKADNRLQIRKELAEIPAVVIGGTSLSGGRGTILGTLIGALIMAVLLNGLRILSVAQEWQTVVTGAIIILAVYADTVRRRKGK